MTGPTIYLFILAVAVLSGCGGASTTRPQSTSASSSVTDYAEISYVKLLAGSADELANKNVSVRCRFLAVDPRYCPLVIPETRTIWACASQDRT